MQRYHDEVAEASTPADTCSASGDILGVTEDDGDDEDSLEARAGEGEGGNPTVERNADNISEDVLRPMGTVFDCPSSRGRKGYKYESVSVEAIAR